MDINDSNVDNADANNISISKIEYVNTTTILQQVILLITNNTVRDKNNIDYYGSVYITTNSLH